MRTATIGEVALLAEYAASRIWAMHRPALENVNAILAGALLRGDALVASGEQLAQIDRHERDVPAGIAIIPIHGMVTLRSGFWSEFFGGACVDRMQAQFRKALGDPSVKAIVLDCDSPGGTVDGVEEFAQEILAARGTKSVWAVANTLCASAAYWIASASDKIVGLSTSQSGSIGIYRLHEDTSEMLKMAGISVSVIIAGEHKAEDLGYEPLSDDARAHLQVTADGMLDMFTRTVAAGRGLELSVVKGEQFGQGRMYGAKAALKRNLIDQIGTMDSVLSKLIGRRAATAMAQRADHDSVNAAAASAARMLAGVVPRDVSKELAPRDTPWSGLRLEDFTEKAWGDLGEDEQRRIAGHFAWASEMPPETFGSLKLGHHRASDGAVVFRGVSAALGRLDQSDIPEADIGKVRSHLEAHQAAFEEAKEAEEAKGQALAATAASGNGAIDLEAELDLLEVM